MGLVLYVILSWLCITFLVTTEKKNEMMKYTVIYLILTIIFAVIYIDMFLNLQIISISSKVTNYLAIMLDRNIVRPVLTVILIIKLDGLISYTNKIAAVILTLALLLIFELVNIKLQLYTYSIGGFLIPLFTNSILIFTALIINKLIYFIEHRSEIDR